MPYCTLTDIIKALPVEIVIQLTDDEHLEPTTIDPLNADHASIIARVDEAIETADVEIDGYCAARYAVPFSPVPGVINRLSVEIAIYYLHCRRSIPEKIEKRCEKAVARLKDIATGKFTLGVDPAPDESTDGDGVETNKTDSDRIFTRDKLGGF